MFSVDEKQNNKPNNIRIIISVAPNSGCAERTQTHLEMVCQEAEQSRHWEPAKSSFSGCCTDTCKRLSSV